jgi:hypothetical protein
VEYYSQWNDPKQLTKEEYMKVLMDTKFVACPRGNNVETFRFYEALECGCIPIFTELPRALEDSNIAFLPITSWEQCAYLIKTFEKDTDALYEYQKRLSSEWLRYKEQLKGRVSEWLQ